MFTINKIEKMFDFVMETIFPTYCLSCGKRNDFICPKCLAKIQVSDRENIENAFSVFNYQDPIIKKAIWKIKYHNQKKLAEELGKILYEFSKENIYEIREFAKGQKILIVPVPIHKKKKAERGYNQAEKIAKGFCSEDKDNIFEYRNDIIYKTKNSKAQAQIHNRKIRLKNTKDSFSCNPNIKIKNRTIILLDDVITTGGTINEIRKQLKKHKPKKIYAFSIAH